MVVSQNCFVKIEDCSCEFVFYFIIGICLLRYTFLDSTDILLLHILENFSSFAVRIG